jgi:hypothetical protein
MFNLEKNVHNHHQHHADHIHSENHKNDAVDHLKHEENEKITVKNSEYVVFEDGESTIDYVLVYIRKSQEFRTSNDIFADNIRRKFVQFLFETYGILYREVSSPNFVFNL